MAGCGRGGTNQRPRPEGEWEPWGESYPYPANPYPHPPHLYPPQPYGYFPNHPHLPPLMNQGPNRPPFFQNQHQGARPRGYFQGGRGRPQQQQHQQRQGQNQDQHRGQIKGVQGGGEQDKEDHGQDNDLMGEGSDSGRRGEGKKTEEKFPQVICFKCGETGHYSSACNKPKVCFICYSKDHVVEACPE